MTTQEYIALMRQYFDEINYEVSNEEYDALEELFTLHAKNVGNEIVDRAMKKRGFRFERMMEIINQLHDVCMYLQPFTENQKNDKP